MWHWAPVYARWWGFIPGDVPRGNTQGRSVGRDKTEAYRANDRKKRLEFSPARQTSPGSPKMPYDLGKRSTWGRSIRSCVGGWGWGVKDLLLFSLLAFGKTLFLCLLIHSLYNFSECRFLFDLIRSSILFQLNFLPLLVPIPPPSPITHPPRTQMVGSIGGRRY